jgi:penicillin-binding protein 1A
MLHGVIRRGTGTRALALGRHDIAGKTGTTNEDRDTWFAGFNADLAAVTWVGFNEDRPLGRGEEGARTALPMWIAFMGQALESVPEHELPVPPGIVEVRINPDTGLAASDGNANARFEKFRIDHVPPKEPESFSANDRGPENTSSTSSRDRIF